MAYVAITDTPIDVTELYHKLVDPKFGGIVTFVGIVREWTDAIQTKSITYTAYQEMAVKQMAQMAAKVEATGSRVVMVHRIGHLELTEAAVFIGVAAPHRKAAFQQCEALIDELKQTVPIWKEEFDADKTRWGGLEDAAN
ncbi:molybdenum cofactor biosynthesis protein MoaE [Agrilactobacillus fermenti]|uniref:molybdenum cofactor biosynthesis protein MoaE n=1 Tax=Agrilactobacillus fermenti TaxID=2586909 RepID=UPI001E2DF9DE|nr:molybdenum cofactor biosynthesis protein MoaE [Agrilactobacillus fermenti]MCD2255664.1 molybdenum cofactor biosynthesis protein MoaE [Agrilactobacillus fermenti]